MSAILLDTHVLLWLTEHDPNLGLAARRAIDDAARGEGVFVSSISFWEVALLARRGRVELTRSMAEWREAVLHRSGLKEIPLDSAIAIDAVALPGFVHADPADRFLIATARRIGATLMTRDVRIAEYARDGNLVVAEA